MSTKSAAECATLLGIDLPRFSGKSQEEVNAKLDAWKEGALREGYRAAVHRTHPDKNPDDPEAGAKFAEVVAAYEQLQDLRVHLKRPEKSCPSGHERIPATAKYCHECGYAYMEDALVQLLRSNGITDRVISYLRSTGELDRIKAIPPFSEDLRSEIRLLQQRQRFGLFSPHSGWK